MGGLFGNETLRKRKRVLRLLLLVVFYGFMGTCISMHAGNCIIIICSPY